MKIKIALIFLLIAPINIAMMTKGIFIGKDWQWWAIIIPTALISYVSSLD